MKMDQESLQQLAELFENLFDRKFDEAFDKAFDRKFDEAFDKAFDRKFPQAFQTAFQTEINREVMPYLKDITMMLGDTMIDVAELKDRMGSLENEVASNTESIGKLTLRITKMERYYPVLTRDYEELDDRLKKIEEKVGI